MAKMDMDDFVPVFGIGSPQRDNRDTAYKFFAGYRINSYFSFEGTYTDFGTSSSRDNQAVPLVTGFPPCLTWDVTRQHSHTATTLWAIGTLPVATNIGAFAKLGAAKVRTEMHTTGGCPGTVGLPAALTNSQRENDTVKAAVGPGIAYDVTQHVSIRFEYEDFGTVGNQFNTVNDVGRSKVSAWLLGVGYRF